MEPNCVRISKLEDWVKHLIDVLVSFEQPVATADLRRIIDVPGNDLHLLLNSIARIAERLEETNMELLFEEYGCVKCNRTPGIFLGADYLRCRYCEEELVPSPKFCINPRNPII